MNNQVIKRIREFCELSSLLNAETNEFITEDTANVEGPSLTKKFSEWNIATKEDWDKKCTDEFTWLVENKRVVLNNIKHVEKEGWAVSCKTIKEVLKQL